MMELLKVLTDGGHRQSRDEHVECRNCGQNLSPNAEECPDCGGEVAVYAL
jgi:rRNA maturation endonuclease Nob1